MWTAEFLAAEVSYRRSRWLAEAQAARLARQARAARVREPVHRTPAPAPRTAARPA